jgi:importin subunit alpha-1
MAIYQKAFDIIERFFGSEDGEDDPNLAPSVSEGGQEFAFSQQQQVRS